MPSTDAAKGSIFGELTKFTDWLQTRVNNIDIFDEHFHVEAKTNPFYSLGGIFYFVWFLVMFTGCVLMVWYVPTKANAFDSILHIQHGIPFGNIMRGVHKYGADAMMIAATMRLYRMFLCADYKPGREFNIAIALVTLLLAMYSGLTGYLLIWNQRAFWATKVFATFPTYMDQFPVMGDFYLPLVKSLHLGWNTAEFLLGAGGAITQETITRFFSLHLAFSAIPLIFVELYFYRTGYKRVPLDWTKRAVIVAMLVAVAVFMPAALGHRSNPDVTPLPILSDWYFLGLYQMYKYLEPVVATEITMVIPVSVVILPFLDVWITGAEKDIAKRPFIFYIALMGFLEWIIFSLLIIVNIANIHSDPPWWRLSLWGLIDVGILLQLRHMWFNSKTVQEKALACKGALTMGILAFIQTLTAFAYFFMARTEMFFSPLTQAWTYMVFKPAIPNAEKAEGIIKTMINPADKANFNPGYWDYHQLMAEIHRGNPVPAQSQVEELYKLVTSPSSNSPLVDWIFQLIPSFTVVTKDGVSQAVPYINTLDYMVSNRWANDFITYSNRMTDKVEKSVSGEYYPLPVPDVDWSWMILGLVATLACVAVYMKFKNSGTQPAATPAPAPAQVAK